MSRPSASLKRTAVSATELTPEAESPVLRGFLAIGAPGFEPGTSCPPDKRANQAAPRPVGDKSNGRAPRSRDLLSGIASDASGPPDKRANQAAPRPVGNKSNGRAAKPGASGARLAWFCRADRSVPRATFRTP